MIDHLDFTYTDAQWDEIKTVVRDRLRLDANQIELHDTRSRSNRMKSLRGCLESAACGHIWRSARESQTPGHKAGIEQLTALRDRAKALGTDFSHTISPSFSIGDMRYRSILHLVDVEHAVSMLVSVAEAHIAAQPQPTANTSKIGRNRFYNEALAIWVSIGGAQTGIAAAEFLVAVSKPVFRSVRAIHGHKTTASTPLHLPSVVEWLRLRAKARQAATS
jgi:hypothetical protein